MEEAQIIFEYLPVYYNDLEEKEYIDFLWETFIINYKSEKYSFAFLSYYMLFMCFVYFEIWKIKENFSEDFQKAMVGFNKDIENELLKATTPYSFWQISESTVFRFFKLIGLDNSCIGRFTAIVKERNNVAHSNGHIFYKNKENLDEKITEIICCVDDIQDRSKPIIEKVYQNFLIGSQYPDKREYSGEEDQINEIFIRRNYLSFKDVKIANEYNIYLLSKEREFENIKILAKALNNIYIQE